MLSATLYYWYVFCALDRLSTYKKYVIYSPSHCFKPVRLILSRVEHRYFEKCLRKCFCPYNGSQWAPKLSTFPNIFTKESHRGLESREGETIMPELVFLVNVIKISLEKFLIIAYMSVYSRPVVIVSTCTKLWFVLLISSSRSLAWRPNP